MIKKLTDSKKAMDILLYISNNYNCYCSKIAYDLKITISHTFGLISFLENKGYISTNNNGRRKYIKITEKGSYAVEVIKRLKDI
jgi:predicted transcriptional regulator